MIVRRRRNAVHTPERIKRRRLQKFRVAVGYVAIFLMTLSVFVWFSHYDGYEIQRVVVNGNNVLTEREVTRVVEETLSGAYFFLFSKKHTMIFPRFAVAKKLRTTFPRIRELDIDISGRQEITVALHERTPYALWCHTEMVTAHIDIPGATQGKTAQPPCYFLDAHGYAFAKAPDFSGSVYTTIYSDIPADTDHAGTQAFSEETFQALNTFRTRFAEEGYENIGLLQHTEAEYWLILDGNGYIKFDVTHDPRKVVEDVMLATQIKQNEHEAFRERLMYIDARFDDRDRIYFQFSP